jgi:hypothetical protein
VTVKPGQILRVNRAVAARTRTAWFTDFRDPGIIRDLIGGQNIPATGTRIVGEDGTALSFDGTQGQQGPARAWPALNRIAFIARIRANNATQPANPGAVFGVYSATGAQGGVGIGLNGLTVGAAWLNANGAGLGAPVAISANTWYTVIVQGAPNDFFGTPQRTWVAGVGSTTATPSSGAADSPMDTVVVGAQYRSAGYLRNARADIAWAAILLGDSADWMTDEIAAGLFASDYPQSLRAPSRTIFLPAEEPEPITGSLSQTLSALSASASGALAISGASASALGSVTASAQGVLQLSGAVNASLAPATLSATGTLPSSGVLSATLAPASLVASATLPASGALASTLGAATLSASAALPITGQASASLSPATLSAVGASSAIPSGVLAATLGAATLVATATKVDALAGQLAATLGPATLAATATTSASPAAGLNGALGSLTASAQGVLSIQGAASVMLGALISQSATSVPITGDAAISLGPLELIASAQLMGQTSGSLSSVLEPASLQAFGGFGNYGQLDSVLADLYSTSSTQRPTMANARYGKGREATGNARINLIADTIRAQLVDTAAYAVAIDSHEYLSEIPMGARIGNPVTLTNKSNTLGFFRAANISFNGLTGAPSLEALVLYKYTGNDATSNLLAYIDTAQGLPVEAGAPQVDVAWGNFIFTS